MGRPGELFREVDGEFVKPKSLLERAQDGYESNPSPADFDEPV
jgi:hypothetical protein